MLARVNEIQINYEWSGNKQGKVILFSHVLGLGMGMWQPQVAAFEPDFSVLRYDMRGHGGTDVPAGPYTLEMLGEDVVGLLDVLGIERVNFVGLSMGGMIGQYLGLAYSRRLHSLTISNTASSASKERQTLLQELIDGARSQGMKALVDSTMARWFTASFIKKNPAMLEVIRKEFLATNVEGFIGACQAIQKLNYTDRLSGITSPTLVMVGDNDPGTPVSSARDIHERVTNSKFLIIRSAQHVSNVEQSEVFNAALLEFLRTNL